MNQSLRSLLGAALYLAAVTAAIYGVIDRFADVVVPGLVLAGLISVLYGYLAARWWSVFLPVFFIPIAEPAGYPPSEFSEPGIVSGVFLFAAPILGLLIGLGLVGRVWRIVAVLACVPLLFVCVVWLGARGDSVVDLSAARFGTIDELTGTYGGAGLGDTSAEVVTALGSVRPVGEDEAVIPSDVAEAEIIPDAPRLEERVGAHCYYDVCLTFTDDSKVQSIELTSPGALTLRGIGVDGSLDAAKAAYPDLDCTVGNDQHFGLYRYCTGQIAPDRWIWFGGDPVNVIVVSSHPLEDASAG